MSRLSSEVSASLMCMDFLRLDEELQTLLAAGITRLHLDFGDGHFVPNLILGIEALQLVGHRTGFRVESHLMIDEPCRMLQLFSRVSRHIIFHVEATSDPVECIRRIRAEGGSPGVAIKPATPAASLIPILDRVDSVLVMTVEPGFAGNPFIPDMIGKVKQLRGELDTRNPYADLVVDGAINERTIPLLSTAGANVFVGGSSGLFTGGDLARQAHQMTSLVHRARCMAQ